jgi:hypothetical protein
LSLSINNLKYINGNNFITIKEKLRSKNRLNDYVGIPKSLFKKRAKLVLKR